MSPPRGVFVGLATLDVIHRVAWFPGPDEKVVARRADLAAGGPATGAAVTFAGLGGEAVLVTALGSGPLAGAVRHDLEQHGVTVHDVAPDVESALPVSSVTVLDDTGERSVVSRNAEGLRVPVPSDLEDRVITADVLLLDGHHPSLAVAAARAARRHTIPVVLDAGSWKPVTEELSSLATMVICSADLRVPDPGHHPEPGRYLLHLGPDLVAVTAGPGPVRWWTRDGEGAVDVPAVRARDTLGAGDVFHGAYAYAVAAGAEPVPALELAAGVAALRVSQTGPRSWLADDALREFTQQASPRRSAPGGGA